MTPGCARRVGRSTPDGDVRLDYAFPGPGVVDLLGIDFDYPEEKMRAKEVARRRPPTESGKTA